MDYKAEMKVSAELRFRCVAVFKECEEFQSPSKLRHFAAFARIQLTDKWLPNAESLDVEIILINLLRYGKTAFEPVLLAMLNALALRYDGDWRQAQCRELEKEIREALLKPEGAEQEQDYQQLVVISGSEAEGNDERAARWIESAGNDWDERALRITLAVFHGTSFETIEREKNDLLKAFQELLPPPPTPAAGSVVPPPRPHTPMMQRLKKAGAFETQGQAPDWRKVIELKQPEIASEALVHVWELYHETKWRQKLIGWLTNCISGRPADVRTRAAVAAGILAIKDYRFVRENLLDLWVQGDDAKHRTAVGMALGVLAREEAWSSEVQKLLRTWSESSEQAERWAALRSYIYVGAYCKPVSEVIERWRVIAGSEYAAIVIQISEDKALRLNNPIHMSLMDAMVRFFVGGAQLPEKERRPLFAGILAGLKKWVSDGKGDAGLGLFMFMTLGRLIVSSEGTSSAPVLLQLVSDGQNEEEIEYRSQLAGLFEVVMRNGATITEARELLCDWVGWVDKLQDNSSSYESRTQKLFEEIITAEYSRNGARPDELTAAKEGRARGKLAAFLRDCGRNQTAKRILANL